MSADMKAFGLAVVASALGVLVAGYVMGTYRSDVEILKTAHDGFDGVG